MYNKLKIFLGAVLCQIILTKCFILNGGSSMLLVILLFGKSK